MYVRGKLGHKEETVPNTAGQAPNRRAIHQVKALPGLGMTVDVILVNGALHEGETVVLAGTDGAIVTQIRGLLMPHPMREMRVKVRRGGGGGGGDGGGGVKVNGNPCFVFSGLFSVTMSTVNNCRSSLSV